MEISILIAKIFGIAAVVEGLLLIVRTTDMVSVMDGLKKSRGATMAITAIALVLGLFLVSVHNIWSGESFQTVITLIGWVVLIKGLVFLLMPHSFTERIITRFNNAKTYRIAGVIEIIVGLWLAISGFVL